jgi:hypothetical protein
VAFCTTTLANRRPACANAVYSFSSSSHRVPECDSCCCKDANLSKPRLVYPVRLSATGIMLKVYCNAVRTLLPSVKMEAVDKCQCAAPPPRSKVLASKIVVITLNNPSLRTRKIKRTLVSSTFEYDGNLLEDCWLVGTARRQKK